MKTLTIYCNLNAKFVCTVESLNSKLSFVTKNFYYSACDLWYKVILAKIKSCLLMRVFYYSEVYLCEIPLYVHSTCLL